jgi:hypothetical protein
MNSRFALFLLVLALPLTLGFGGGGNELVLIEKAGTQSFLVLRDTGITPHLRGEGWLLATAESQDKDRISEQGFRVLVLDNTPWSHAYFVVSTPGEGAMAGIPSSFRELARVPEGAIVEGEDKDVGDLTRAGLRVTRIHEREIPLLEEKANRRSLPESARAMLPSLVPQVSDSAITEYMTRLEAFRTRYSFSDSVSFAAEWIHDKFLEFGFTDVSYDSFPFAGTDQRNVVAVKAGSVTPDKVIVIGGHYDSVTYDSGCDPDTLAPGVDDNASGTVVTMEAARVLAGLDTDMTLIFVPFAAEEQGLWGSEHFAEEAFNQGMDIVLMFNMDMVSNLADSYWDVNINASLSSVPYAEIVAGMAESYTDLIPFIVVGVSAGSDHYYFHQFGYDFVYAEEGDFSPQWHRCNDTMEHISIPYLTDVTEMITASILFIANTPVMPAGLSAANVGDGTSLFLTWEPNTEGDLAGYRIYYGTESGVYDSVKTVSSPQDTLQNLLPGTTYYIAVTAFDGDTNESLPSEEVEITASEVPNPPMGLVAVSLSGSVELEWDENQGELDVAGYNVYRRPAGEGEWEFLGMVPAPGTSFADATPLAHVLYSYHVRALDTQMPPNESEPSNEVMGRLATHDMGILLVDNTKDGSGAPFSPTDEEVDSFYGRLLEEYNLQATWDVSDSTAVDRRVKDYDMGIYSTVVWHSDVRTGVPIAPETVALQNYLDTGGALWLSGWKLLSSLSGMNGPEYVFEEGSFISRYMGIDSARTSPNADADFLGARGLVGEFNPLEIDPEKVPLGGLVSMDVFTGTFQGIYPLYAYVSSDSQNPGFHGMPVGLADSSADYGLVVTDFPLYFMGEEDVASLTSAVMELFGEPVGVGGEEESGIPRSYTLSQNYPNPFNPVTTIAFEIPGDEGSQADLEKVETALSIFDVRGRRVAVLLEERLSPGRYRITWDGRDSRGKEVSSGIYFYRIDSGAFSSTRKMMLVK